MMSPDSFMLARALASERTQTRAQRRRAIGGANQILRGNKVLHFLNHKLQRSAAYLPPLRLLIGLVGLGWLRQVPTHQKAGKG